MKRFKDLLNEFIMPRGGNDPQGDYGKYMRRKVKELMKKTPITIRLPEGHQLKFNNTEFATRVAAEHRALHHAGLIHSSESDSDKAKLMTKFFGVSENTHDEMIDKIESHIMNHRDTPEHYKEHVRSTIDEIVQEHAIDEKDSGRMRWFGQSMMNSHSPRSATATEHPHLDDTTHHLSGVIEDLDNHPEEGYFLRKENM